jgi:hypothetical protein
MKICFEPDLRVRLQRTGLSTLTFPSLFLNCHDILSHAINPMGDNKKFYIIIIILAGIVLLQFLLKPRSDDKPSFEKTLEEIKTTLADFKTRNDEIKNAAKSLADSQAAAERHYESVRMEFQVKLDAIQGQIASARNQYTVLIGKLGELNEKFQESGAPDSIPSLDQLSEQN